MSKTYTYRTFLVLIFAYLSMSFFSSANDKDKKFIDSGSESLWLCSKLFLVHSLFKGFEASFALILIPYSTKNNVIIFNSENSSYKSFNKAKELTCKAIKNIDFKPMDCQKSTKMLNKHSALSSKENRARSYNSTGPVTRYGKIINSIGTMISAVPKKLERQRSSPYLLTPGNALASLWDLCFVSVVRNVFLIGEILNCYLKNGRLIFDYSVRTHDRGLLSLGYTYNPFLATWISLTRKGVIRSCSRSDYYLSLILGALLFVYIVRQAYLHKDINYRERGFLRAACKVLVVYTFVAANCFMLHPDNIIYGLMKPVTLGTFET